MSKKIVAFTLAFILLTMAAVFTGFPGTTIQANSGTTFVNSLYNGCDPYVTKGPDGYYYYIENVVGGIDVYKSNSLTDRGTKRRVWTPPSSGSYSRDVWAPELHYINGSWYIYTCANDGIYSNQRPIVLKANTSDPQGSYTYQATLNTGSWGIDPTVLQKSDGSLYCIWSGLPQGAPDDSTQHIFISEMSSPTSLTGPIVDLSGSMYSWETIGRPNGLNEGPQVIQRNGKIFVIYSASGSWTADYCLGQLTCTNVNNPVSAASWTKKSTPVFSKFGNVYGPGHASFTKSPNGNQDWIVYHSSLDSGGSWTRAVSIKQFTWNADDSPNFGTPVQWGASTAVPSGEPINTAGSSLIENFSVNDDKWQTIRPDKATIESGEFSIDNMSSESRYGDKALIRNYDYTNFTLESDIKIIDGTIDGDLIFRVREPAVGLDAFKGYVASINVNGYVEVGKVNGSTFTRLATSAMTVNKNQWYHMKVIANGSNIKVYVGDMVSPKVNINDNTYTTGMVGVRAVYSHVHFDNFAVSTTTSGYDPNLTYKLVNRKSGRVLSCLSAGTANNTSLVIYDWVAAADQLWKIQDAGSGYYKLINNKSNRAASCLSGGASNNTNCILYDYVSATDQNWTITNGNSGYLKLVNQRSSRAMSCYQAGTSNNTPVMIYDWVSADDQDWTIVPAN